MAKITSPLLSLGGSGTIGKAVTFSKWKGRPYARQRVVPANPNTTAQQQTRGVFKNGQLLYKQSPAIAREPWQRFVAGQAQTEWNAFTGRFISDLRGDSDLADMTFSPGAKGGLPPVGVVLTPTNSQITVAFTNPAAPTGWTLTATQAALVTDANPESMTVFDWVAGEDAATQSDVVLTGLTASTQYAVGAWLKWTKPDGSLAYGASITNLSTTLA